MKTEPSQPSDPTPLHVGRPNIGNRDALLSRIEKMLDQRWFSNDGPLVREFEAALASYLGVKHCVAVCNATVGLEIAAKALGLTGEVILPAFTFIATAHALQWQGITPVFADLDPRTHNLAADQIEGLITPQTTGIVGVHVWGRPCDTVAIERIATKHGLQVMYDAAHAFGCTASGRMVGGNGACEVFSFHATKFLNSFEGGAVTTNDDALAEQLRLLRNFGFQGNDNVVSLGINGKMSEVCAAMGLTSLDAIDELIDVNRNNYLAYQEALAGVAGVSLIDYPSDEKTNFQYIVIEIDPEQCRCSRDDLVNALQEQNIYARRYFWPGCHRMEPYRSLDPNSWQRLPHTEHIASRIVVLPTGQAIDEGAVKRVCDTIKQTVH